MANLIRTAAAVGICKAARSALRILHRGGTTTPGKVAMKVDPRILETVSKGMEVILVTGTNGKTTTCRMLEHTLTSAGKDTIANRSGANLLPGVVAEFVSNASLSGHPKKHYAVMECDEGALKQIVPLVHPKVIVVTNLFRDQLDRYGEITNTLEEIRIAASKAPESILCLNADCSLTSSLGEDLPNPVRYFGIDIPLEKDEDVEVSDARTCLRCGTPYEYTYHTYAHLGGFFCPSCGYKRKDTQIGITKIHRIDAKGSSFRLHAIGGEGVDVSCGLPAVYNIYNAVAALAANMACGLDLTVAAKALGTVTSSFGRMETFDLNGVPLLMILIKNTAGCNQSISYLSYLHEEHAVAFCLNDRTGDGHDISWIWDADYERVCADPLVKKIFVQGDRAEDMQLRLKYAGAAPEVVTLVPSEEALIDAMRKSPVPVYILPNYTSMLSLRTKLGEATGKGKYWET